MPGRIQDLPPLPTVQRPELVGAHPRPGRRRRAEPPRQFHVVIKGPTYRFARHVRYCMQKVRQPNCCVAWPGVAWLCGAGRGVVSLRADKVGPTRRGPRWGWGPLAGWSLPRRASKKFWFRLGTEPNRRRRAMAGTASPVWHGQALWAERAHGGALGLPGRRQGVAGPGGAGQSSAVGTVTTRGNHPGPLVLTPPRLSATPWRPCPRSLAG